jgi:hypothetical protein
LRALAAAKGLPKLRELRLELTPTEWRTTPGNYGGELFERDVHAYAWLWTAPWFAQLETLVARYHLTSSVASWIGLMRQLRTLTLHGTFYEIFVTKLADKLTATIRPRGNPERAPDLIALRDALTAAGVASVHVAT